jgi:hypothetical protein
LAYERIISEDWELPLLPLLPLLPPFPGTELKFTLSLSKGSVDISHFFWASRLLTLNPFRVLQKYRAVTRAVPRAAPWVNDI